MNTFAAIDFETSYGNNACAVGICVVNNLKIEDEHYFLIKPQNPYFSPYNIEVHGITPHDVENKPTFDELWGKLKPLLENRMVVAHNAPFDMSVLQANLGMYQITHPEFDFLCTVSIARRLWKQLPNHKLNTLAGFFNFKFKHHNAIDDAIVCAKVAIEALKMKDLHTLYQLAESLKIKAGSFSYPFGFEKQQKLTVTKKDKSE